MSSSYHWGAKRFSSVQAILATSCSAAFLTECTPPVKMAVSPDDL